MNKCYNCFGFVHKGRFCDECKERSVDGKLKCTVCNQYENMRFMKYDICNGCQQSHSFDKCMYCDKHKIISKIHNMCEDCMDDRCCYCSDERLNALFTPKYSWVFGCIVCKACRNIKGKGNYICEQVHALCSSNKYKCCVCKDERMYERDCN
jgi:hypothetical protein